MTSSQFHNKYREIQQQKKELEKKERELIEQYNKDFPFVQEYKGRIVEGYDYLSGVWTERFRMEGIKPFGLHELLVFGPAVLKNGKIDKEHIIECVIKDLDNIDVRRYNC